MDIGHLCLYTEFGEFHVDIKANQPLTKVELENELHNIIMHLFMKLENPDADLGPAPKQQLH